ncbi:hypothetical protein [Adhaeribacter radiodurans]|uniref:Lipoprotein n=1 Tax=Adhaeribacter radiodurans TaxID=2745197 RepID=A0A7L7LAA3_9BACT|nr:hypothetical protein [Adhaeribacter radiodurans]QMU29772.1 hypothetical protein HUW48_17860 [Adhaeribacter radiodurans]
MKFLLCFFLLLTFFSCSKEDAVSPSGKQILGIWFQEDSLPEDNRISKLQYHFKEDNTLEILRIELDANSRQVLGYRYRSTARFSLVKDQLSFSDFTNYIHNDSLGSYSSLQDLKAATPQLNGYIVTCKLEDKGRKLTFIYPPCKDTFNCIGAQTFSKE